MSLAVLVVCEYSARVRDAFRARGHFAWSVDTLPTDGDPRWHVQADVRTLDLEGWDLMIAFPPCTHLSCVGARYWPKWSADGRQAEAFALVRRLWDAPIPMVAIENPQGWLNSNWQRPTQTIQPWMFGDPWTKRTCLWLRGLPALSPTERVLPVGPWVSGGRRADRTTTEGARWDQKLRMQTFPGIARAMAEQWGRP